MTVVIAEHRDGRLSRASAEAIAAAGQIPGPIAVIVAGAETGALAAELADFDVTEVIRLEHEQLGTYSPDAMVAALARLLPSLTATLVVVPHTYQTRDYAPRLAARLGTSLLSDCVGVSGSREALVFSRPMFQGRMTADVALDGPGPHVVSFQIGAYRANDARRRATPAPIRVVQATIEPGDLRQVPEPPFREARQDLDLTQADRIVAVGRGIKEPSHLAIVEQLARALGAEIGASRPVCDAGWLPMDRQIGSSGQTVAPRLYVALGISGAVQHIVGMKGARTIVAVNKDADAPIFEVADYGIVGDLFEVVPALIAALDA